MENSDNENTSRTTEPVNENASQEITSTTEPEEITKRKLRVKTWKALADSKVGLGRASIFNVIPVFLGANTATELLSQLDEYKNAQHISVGADRALYDVRLKCLSDNKQLYLPGTRDTNAYFLRVNVPENASEEVLKESLRSRNAVNSRIEIQKEDNIKFDMVIVGSVLVSREGHRIGRGRGYLDLDIGLFIELGAITPETLIVSVVHDLQVIDSLPHDLFQSHDTPVDLIVTPTQIIRIEKRLPRPVGIIWELLSERRLKNTPVLQKLKEMKEKEGQSITLKSENTDTEQNQSKRRNKRLRRFQRRPPNNVVVQSDNNEKGDSNPSRVKREPRYKRRFFNRKARTIKSDGEQSGNENKSQDQDRNANGAAIKRRRSRYKSDFLIKLSNIARETRVKDIKSELRKRECNPHSIVWKGYIGKCVLIFGRRNSKLSIEEEIDKVMTSLNDMSITVPARVQPGGQVDEETGAEVPTTTTKTFHINVELIKQDPIGESKEPQNKTVVEETKGDKVVEEANIKHTEPIASAEV